MNTLVGTREGSPAVENTLAVALVAGAFHDAVVVLLLEGSHARHLSQTRIWEDRDAAAAISSGVA